MMMSMTARKALSVAVAAILAGFLALTVTAHAATPTAHTAATCDVTKDGRKLGATYVTKLTVTKVTCTKGKTLVKAFNKCRRAHGGAKGKCSSFSGYRCTETRKAIPTEFSANATCKASGGRSLKIGYTEFT